MAAVRESELQQTPVSPMAIMAMQTENIQQLHSGHVEYVENQNASENINVVQENGDFDKELFLQALRDFKCLWDTSDTNYKNRTMKLNAWKSLSQMFNQEGWYTLTIFGHS